jgi:hypothetical protein
LYSKNKPSHAGGEEEQEEEEEGPDPESLATEKRRKLSYFEGNVVWLEVQKHADLIAV